ncbi:MAG: TVP38/TMEM64 family protein [Alphaproteobacteria bacterium]|nr:TVP38/TMEM64 family protein [Alphaproteobacteria bacterium]
MADKPRFTLTRLLPLLLLVAGFAAFFALGLQHYLNLDLLQQNHVALKQWVDAHLLEAAGVFVVAYIVAAAFSLPVASLLSIAGGFLFGTVYGSLWIIIGATIGASILFLAAKTALGDPLRARFADRIKGMEEGFRANAFSYLLLLRLVPLFPFFLVNLAAAFTGVSLGLFVLTTAVGIIPGAFVFASIGNGIGALFEAGAQPDLSLTALLSRPDFYIPIIGFALLSLLPIIYRALVPRKSAP